VPAERRDLKKADDEIADSTYRKRIQGLAARVNRQPTGKPKSHSERCVVNPTGRREGRSHSRLTGPRAESFSARSRGEISMDAEPSKGEQHHGLEEDGRNSSREPGPRQTFTAFDSPRALTVNLREQVCDPKNIVGAYRRVRSNKGKPGVDGRTVLGLADWLRDNRAALTASLYGGADSEAGRRTTPVGDSGGCGSSGSTDDSASAPPPSRSHFFQLQLRIPAWTRRPHGVRTGAGLRSPGGARVCRRSGPREVFRSSPSRYPDVSPRAQDR
jgi:hypothetical protein